MFLGGNLCPGWECTTVTFGGGMVLSIRSTLNLITQSSEILVLVQRRQDGVRQLREDLHRSSPPPSLLLRNSASSRTFRAVTGAGGQSQAEATGHALEYSWATSAAIWARTAGSPVARDLRRWWQGCARRCPPITLAWLGLLNTDLQLWAMGVQRLGSGVVCHGCQSHGRHVSRAGQHPL